MALDGDILTSEAPDGGGDVTTSPKIADSTATVGRPVALVRRIERAATPVLGVLIATAPQLTSTDFDTLVTQVVETVSRAVAAGKKVDNLDSYSRRVARNTFYRRIRGEGRAMVLGPAGEGRRGGQLQPWFEDLVTNIGGTTRVLGAEDAAGLAIEAFERLRPLEWSILVLRHRSGLSSEEAAKQLGYKNRGVVDAATARAHVKLTRNLLALMSEPARRRPQ